MAIFARKSEEEIEDEPAVKRKKKEPVKPWGRKERSIVLVTLFLTAFTSLILALSARDFKLPGLPHFSTDFKDIKLNLFKEETITIGKGTDKDKQRADKIIADFKAKTDGLSGTYALYVTDLSSNYSFGIDEERVMQAASLIKLPVMLYALGKVDDSQIEAMGKRSDNNIFIKMRQKFSDQVLQNYIASLGMANTSIERNETTPKEMGDCLRKIYLDKNGKLLSFLTDTIFEDWLVKGVPEGVRIAHKYGREIHVVNDAGIVYSKSPYIVVIMTQGIIEKEADEVFPTLSKLVYDGMTQ